MSVYFEIRYYNTETLKQAERAGEPIAKDDWNVWSVRDRIETGKAAADKVAELKELHGEDYTFAIVRVDTLGGDRNYLMRELGRLQDGTYKQIPGHFPDTMPETFGSYWTPESYENQFAKVSFQQFLMQQNPDHVPHISQNNERKVAFTESMEKGRKDIQKALYTHEYLAKYLSNKFQEYGPMDLIIDAMGGLTYKLHLTETVEDMVAIYQECDTSREVGSCMTHSTCSYESSPHHPVEPYALGGDLSLAYVRAEGDTGTIWGRCLVWPERKLYTRIYSTNAALMRKVLKAAGYERQVDTLAGARLGLIRLDGNRVVMPYIDGSQSAHWDGEHLLIAHDGNTQAGNTSGTAYLEDAGRAECASCGNSYNDEEDGNYVEGVGGYCSYCSDNYTYYCEGYNEVYDHRRESMHHVDGSTYCESYYSENCFECDDCREDFHNEGELNFDEANNHILCNDCYSSLIAKREEEQEEEEDTSSEEPDWHQMPPYSLTLSLYAKIITGNSETYSYAEPQIVAIDMSGRIAPSDIPSGITVPIGFAVWQPQRPHHAPQFWPNRQTLSDLVTTAQLRNNIPQGGLSYSSWNFDSVDSYYIVPIETITGTPAAYRLAA